MRANNGDVLSKEKQTLLLLNQILLSTKKFSTDKVVNFEEIVNECQILDDPYHCKELYHEFKNYLLGSPVTSKFENNWKSVILNPTSSKTVTSLPLRLKQHKPEYDKFLQVEEKFTNDVINAYTNLKSDVNLMKEFSKLEKITDNFLSHLTKDVERNAYFQDNPKEPESNLELLMNSIAIGNKLREKSLSHNLPPNMVKDNPDLPSLVSLLPINPKPRCPSPQESEGEGEDEGDDEDDEESISDYFAGVRHEKKPFLKNQPPQNMIRPKNFSMTKQKYGSASFRKKEQKKPVRDPDFKFFEII